MAEDTLIQDSGELDPITQQPVYTRKAPKPVIKAYFDDYYDKRVGTSLQTPVGQYFPEEITSALENIPVSQLEDVPEYQAQSQSSGAKWANAAAKMGITALTTVADGTIGTILGLTNIDGEDKNGNPLSDFVNNPFSQAMLDVGDWAEKALPNYYSKEEQDNPWYENLDTANFWADKVLKNFGFAIGAYASGALTAGAGSYLTGANKLARGLSSKIAKGLISKTLGGLGNPADEKAVLTALMTRGANVSDDLVKGLAQEAKQLKKLNLTNQIIGSVGGSVGEARIEAGHAMREFVETNRAEVDAAYEAGQLSDEQYQSEMADIDKKSLTMGNHVFALNMAVLSASNFAQFRHAFAGGYDTQRKVLGNIVGDVKQGFKPVVAATKFGKAMGIAKGTAIGLKNAMIEGNEEMLQRVASESSKDHYSKMLDGAGGGADEFVNSIWDGFKNTYGNVDAWEEFVIGAFSGGIGIPTIQNKKLSMAGGVFSDISEQRSKGKRTQAVVDNLNKVINSDEFKNRYYAANVDMKAEKAKLDAIRKGDKFEWKTQEDLQVANMVNAFYNAGQLDQLYDWIDGTGNASAEDLKSIGNVTKDVTEDDKLVPKAEPKPLFENWTDEEIVTYNKAKAQALKEKVQEVREIREAIDVKFGGALDDMAKTILTTQLSSLKNVDFREQELHNLLQKINPLLDGRKVTDISKEASSLALKSGWINTFTTRQKSAKGQITRLNNVIEALEGKIVEAQASANNAGAVAARRKASSEDSKVKGYREKLDRYKKEVEVRKEELDGLLKEEFEKRKKVVEQSPSLYQDMTFEEYRDRVNTLSDKIEEFEDSVKKSYDRIGDIPETFGKREEVQTVLKDLYKLNELRDTTIKNYTDSVEKLQKDPKAFVKMREEVQNNIADREADATVNRMLSGAENLKKGFLVTNKQTGEEFRIEKIGDETLVVGKDAAGRFSKRTDLKVDRDFVKTYIPTREFDKVKANILENLAKSGAAQVVSETNGLYIHNKKLFAKGIIYSYSYTDKDEATGASKEVVSTFLQTPDGKFYRIYGTGDNAVLGVKEYTVLGLNKGTLTSTETEASVSFDGELRINNLNGETYLVRSEHIPELDAKIEQQNLQELTEEEQSLGNIEALETEDELSTMKDASAEVVTEVVNNPEKVLLHATIYTTKDNGKTFESDVTAFRDTPQGREALQNLIDRYAEETGGSLISDIYSRKNPELRIGSKKYHFSFPKKVPKRIVIIAKDRKDTKGKLHWGKPKVITDVKELNEIKDKIQVSKKTGKRYIVIGKKVYFVKEVDSIGDNAKYAHWKYRYNLLTKDGDKYFYTPYGKDKTEVIDVDKWLSTHKKGVDYTVTSKGFIKVFNKIAVDDNSNNVITEVHNGAAQKYNKDLDRFETSMFNFYEDSPLDGLTELTVNDTRYQATTKSGDRIGIKRTRWKNRMVISEGSVTFGKSEKFTYADEEQFSEEVNYVTGEVTETTDKIPYNEFPQFPISEGVLFANTFAEIDTEIGTANDIDHQKPKAKRYHTYMSNNNVLDGEHTILVMSGATANDVENPISIKTVIAKKDGDKIRPIDISGNFITNEEVFEKGIFTEAPLPDRFSVVKASNSPNRFTISQTTPQGSKEISIPEPSEAVVRKEVDRYKAWYAGVVTSTAKGETESFPIIKVTMGHQLERVDKVEASTREALPEVTSRKDDTNIVIGGSKTKSSLVTGNVRSLKPGWVYLEDTKTGNLYALQTNKLSQEQIDTVLKIFEVFTNQMTYNSFEGKISMSGASDYNGFNLFRDGLENIIFFQDMNNINFKGVQKLKELEDRIRELQEESYGQLKYSLDDVLQNPDIFDSLAGIQKARIQGIKDEIKKIKEGKDKGYTINNNPKTQLYIQSSDTVVGGMIVIGETILPLIDQSDVSKHQLNPAVREALSRFLSDRRVNIIRSKANKEGSFTTLSIEDGELTTKKTSSYNDYVLDNTSTTAVEHTIEDNKISNVGKKVIWKVNTVVKDTKPTSNAPQSSFEKQLNEATVAEEKTTSVPAGKSSFESQMDAASNETGETAVDEDILPKGTIQPVNKESALRDAARKGLFRVSGKTEYIPEDRAKFLAWSNRVFGEQFTLDFIKLEGTIVQGRWGEFSDNLIKVYADAELGTGYHEAFHAVLRMFMTRASYNALIEQFKNDSRFEKRLADIKKLYPDKSETLQIEEVLAEEFREYVLTEGKSLAVRKAPKAKGLFAFLERVYNWITGKNKDVINELFSKINTGYYKNKSPNLSRSNDVMLHKTELSKQEISDSMEGVTNYFFKGLYDDSIVKDGLYELFGKEGINPEVLKKIYDYTKDSLKTLSATYISIGLAEEAAFINNIVSDENWESIYLPLHQEHLKQYGIESVEEEKDDNKADKSESGSAYNYSSLKVSAKASSTRMMKALIGGLPKVDYIDEDGTTIPVFNEKGLPKQADFGKNFSILMNNLSNTTSVEEKLDLMNAVKDEIPEIRILIDKLKIEEFVGNPLSLNARQVDLLAKFNQTFSKNTNQYLYGMLGTDGAYKLLDANSDTLTERIKLMWKAAFNKSIEGSGKNKVTKKPDGVYYYNPEYFKKYQVGNNLSTNAETITSFLNDLGIYVDTKTVVAVKANNKSRVDFIGTIFNDVIKGNQPNIFSNTKDADFTERLRTFLMEVAENSIDFVENAHFNMKRDLVYNNTVNSPMSLVFNKLNSLRKKYKDGDKFKQSILEELPHLDPNFSYNRNSLILNEMLTKPSYQMTVHIIEGNRPEQEEGKSFDDFTEPERLFTWYKAAEEGYYVLMRPSDNSIERFLKIPEGTFDVLFEDGMLNYLKDELTFAADKSNFRFKNFKENIENNIVMDIVRSTEKDSVITKRMLNAIKTGKVNEFISSNKTGLKDIFKAYYATKVTETTNRFKEYGITPEMLGTKYSISKFVRDHYFSSIEQTKLITGNIQLFKSLADMYKRNSSVANTKKISWVATQGVGIESWITKNLRRVDKTNPNDSKFWYKNKPVLNTIIVNDVVAGSRYMKELETILGEDRAKGYNSYNETDGMSIAHIEEIREMLFRAGDWNDSFEELYQHEMQNYLNWRIIKESDSAKKAELISKFNYAFGNYEGWVDKTKVNPNTRLNSLKPQYRGPLAIDGFYPAMYKTSFLPASPSMFMNFETGEITSPNMAKMFDEMIDNGVGVVSFYSATKGATTLINNGVDGEISDGKLEQPLYNQAGTFTGISSYIQQPTLYEYWGIQVDTGFKTKHSVVYGTQMMKQIMNGIYDAGEFISEGLNGLVSRFKSLNADRISAGLEGLTKKLGLTLDEDGNWNYSGEATALVEALKKEVSSRNMPKNTIDSINQLNNGLPLDALVNANKLKTILFSMADKMVISQKAFGKAPYQVTSTLMEKDGIRIMEDYKGVNRFASNDLRFYRPEYDNYVLNDKGEKVLDKYGDPIPAEGAVRIKTSSMEVYLPSYMKGIVNVGQVDSRLLQLVGFRIPTQGLNSIESIVVKGFLSDAYGDVIVLPSEIVAKTGSDFDIDKMNIYIPHFYMDEYNNPVYLGRVRGVGVDGTPTLGNVITYEAYNDSQKKILNQRILNILKKSIKETTYSEFKYAEVTKVVNSVVDSLYEFDGDITLDKLAEGIIIERDKLLKNNSKNPILTELSLIAYELDLLVLDNAVTINLLSKEEFDKKILENEMLAVMDEIITHPDNARQLLNPIDSDNHKELAKKLRVLAGKDKKVGFDSYGDVLHHLQVAKQNMEGAGTIGIAANAAVFQIYAAMHDFKVAPSFRNFTTKTDKAGDKKIEVIDTRINLPHNQKDGLISLGGLKDANGKEGAFSYEAFNAYINLSVDNAKDPILDDLVSGLQTMNTVLYLAMAGVPYKAIHYFMAQPIIKKYLANMVKYESDVLKANSTHNRRLDKFTDEILFLTAVEYGYSNMETELSLAPSNTKHDAESLSKLLESPTGDAFNKKQVEILVDFVRYQRTATELGKAIQGIQYDTKSFGKNELEAVDLLETTTDVIKKGVVINYSKAFDEGGFIAPYKKALGNTVDRLAQFSIILRNSGFKRAFYEFMDKYHAEDVKMGRERRLIALNIWGSDILSYLLTSKEFKLNTQEKELNTPMNTRINKLFKGSNSVPSRISDIKNIIERGNLGIALSPIEQNTYNKYSKSSFIENLSVDIDNEKPIHGMKLHSKRLDPLQKDIMTEEWEEWLNSNDLLATDMIEFAILQSGMQESPLSFTELIPYEIFGNIVSSVVKDNVSVEDSIKYSVQMYLNNRVNDDVVKKGKVNDYKLEKLKKDDLLPFYKVPKLKAPYQNSTSYQLDALKRAGVRPWMSSPQLVLVTDDGQIDVPDFSQVQDYRNNNSLKVYGTKEMNAFTALALESMNAVRVEAPEITKEELLEDYSQSTGAVIGMPKPKTTINVYWGQAESETSTRLLSNLAPRKFIWNGRGYGSVEHAYQSNKSGTFDKATYDTYNSIGGYGRKIRGKGTVAEMKAANSLELMKDLVVTSFKQNANSEAAKKLLQYENFTHNTNELIDKAFLEGLKLAQKELLIGISSMYYGRTTSGSSVESLISEKDWKALSSREQDNFIKCN